MENMIINAFFGGLGSAIQAVWWIIPFLLLLAFLKSPLFKGWFGEKIVQSRLDNHLDESLYRPYHDLIIPFNETSTQIDHIYVSPYGIFVVETKNYSGWIFGSAQQAKWTQVVYKKKSSFQNPLRQNYAHIKALSKLLDLPEQKFHSVIVFLGGCEFKTDMPPNVCYPGQAQMYIEGFQTAILNQQELDSVCGILENQKYSATYESRKAHVRGIKRKYG